MIKKAYELHKLCGVEIALIMIDGKNRLYEYVFLWAHTVFTFRPTTLHPPPSPPSLLISGNTFFPSEMRWRNVVK